MSRTAPRVHADQTVINRMEALCDRLEQDARVAVQTDQGEWVRGIVSPQPTVQTFFVADGREGLNGGVKIETFVDDGRPQGDGRDIYLWLDEVAFVERLPNPSPPEASNRTDPPDPNAPTVDR